MRGHEFEIGEDVVEFWHRRAGQDVINPHFIAEKGPFPNGRGTAAAHLRHALRVVEAGEESPLQVAHDGELGFVALGCAFPSEAGKGRVDDGFGASSRFLHREQPVDDLLHALVGTPHAERGQLRGIGQAGDSVDGLGLPRAESGHGDRGAAILGAGLDRRKDGQRQGDEPNGEEPVPAEIPHAESQPENLPHGKNAATSPSARGWNTRKG